MDLDLLQWPAMLVTLAASWWVASSKSERRKLGFWAFLASNALWIAWGLQTSAPALIALQVGLAAMNIRGAVKTRNAEKVEHHRNGAEPAGRRRWRSNRQRIESGSVAVPEPNPDS